MKALNIVIVFAFIGLILLAGCPRDADNNGSENIVQNSQSSRTTHDAAGDADSAADITDVADVAEDTDETTAAVDDEDAENVTEAAEDTEAVDADSAAAEDVEQGDEMPVENEKKDGVTTVILETTKGDIVLEVHEEWAPIGVAHFLELIEAKFYDGAPWFRVIDSMGKPFVAQCGVAADPAMNTEWGNKRIMDEPVVVGNKPGYMAFGKGGPNSRSTHIFINLSDNSGGLDRQGFCCFAQVVEGFDVAQKLSHCEWSEQGVLGQEGGLEKFKNAYPDADYILKAYIK